LTQPFHQVEVGVEKIIVIQRQVGRRDGNAPIVGAFIGFSYTTDDFKKGGHGPGIFGYEANLVAFFHVEVDILEQELSVYAGTQTGDFEDGIARLPVGGENDARIAP